MTQKGRLKQYSTSGEVWEIGPVLSCAEGKQVMTCSAIQNPDVQDQILV